MHYGSVIITTLDVSWFVSIGDKGRRAFYGHTFYCPLFRMAETVAFKLVQMVFNTMRQGWYSLKSKKNNGHTWGNEGRIAL